MLKFKKRRKTQNPLIFQGLMKKIPMKKPSGFFIYKKRSVFLPEKALWEKAKRVLQLKFPLRFTKKNGGK